MTRPGFKINYKNTFINHISNGEVSQLTLLVALALFGGEFVHPAQFGFAVLAHDIANHVTARQHNTVLNIAECEIDDLLEEVSSPCGSRESKEKKNEISIVARFTLSRKYKFPYRVEIS